eukprot:TRINITY_DN4357_c0_g2_i1.p1 TRINITY_DN4357_c0_g2~~TRINITY_DN4357_c0_g2_i1.p1  ORF type:complete len:521 (-),score=29.94 TRINITY_DN4357_c0_g2_i1:168-1730(-)
MTTRICATMKSKAAAPRIPSSVLRAMYHETKNALREDRTLTRYVLDKFPSTLTMREKKLILNGRKFPRSVEVTDAMKDLLIRFANYCANWGIDFRTLDIPQIFAMAPYNMTQAVQLEEYLRSYVVAYERLLHALAVPIHLYNGNDKWEIGALWSFISFFSELRNQVFRNSVIGANNVFKIIMFSEIDRRSVATLVPERVLEQCTFDEVVEVNAIARTNQSALMVYYRDHSMFDTAQPEIYISRLKALFTTPELKEKVDKLTNLAKSVTHNMIEGVNEIVSYASSTITTFGNLFAEAAMRAKAMSDVPSIEHQVAKAVLSAGVGEIDIAVNHVHPAFEPTHVERALGRDRNSMHRENFTKEFKLIKLLLSKLGPVKVQSRFEMIITKMADLNEEAKANDEVSIALRSERKERGADMDEHVVFKFPRDNMWECRRPEAIDRMFDGFMHAYEHWNENAHDRSGLSVIGVAHIKLNFMQMPAGGCLKDMIVAKVGKCVWVTKILQRNQFVSGIASLADYTSMIR